MARQSLHAPTVLIIEDEFSFREALEMAISDEGYKVVSAANGAEALKLLNTVDPDLILMDVHMPVMNGIEFLREYHERKVRNIPVIVCSTWTQRIHIDLTKVAAFLAKPVDIDDLIRTLHQHLAVANRAPMAEARRRSADL